MRTIDPTLFTLTLMALAAVVWMIGARMQNVQRHRDQLKRLTAIRVGWERGRPMRVVTGGAGKYADFVYGAYRRPKPPQVDPNEGKSHRAENRLPESQSPLVARLRAHVANIERMVVQQNAEMVRLQDVITAQAVELEIREQPDPILRALRHNGPMTSEAIGRDLGIPEDERRRRLDRLMWITNQVVRVDLGGPDPSYCWHRTDLQALPSQYSDLADDEADSFVDWERELGITFADEPERSNAC